MQYILKKIANQFLKIKKALYKYKLSNYLNKFASVGDECFIQFPVCIEGIEQVKLGNNVSINAFVHIWGQGGVTIGSDSLIASHVSIVSVTHDVNSTKFRNSIIKNKVTIGKNVWIGSHVVIMPGVSIGDNVVIGAGSIVTKDLESNGVYIGSPAKKTKDLIQFNKQSE